MSSYHCKNSQNLIIWLNKVAQNLLETCTPLEKKYRGSLHNTPHYPPPCLLLKSSRLEKLSDINRSVRSMCLGGISISISIVWGCGGVSNVKYQYCMRVWGGISNISLAPFRRFPTKIIPLTTFRAPWPQEILSFLLLKTALRGGTKWL